MPGITTLHHGSSKERGDRVAVIGAGPAGGKTLDIEPGSPCENGYVESFNGKLRDEFLAHEVFDTLLEAKVLIERWRKIYNTVRPHSSLGYQPPAPAARRPHLIEITSSASS